MRLPGTRRMGTIFAAGSVCSAYKVSNSTVVAFPPLLHYAKEMHMFKDETVLFQRSSSMTQAKQGSVRFLT